MAYTMTFLAFGALGCFAVGSSLIRGIAPCIGKRCGVEYAVSTAPGDFWMALGGWYAIAWGMLSLGFGGFMTFVAGPANRQ